MLAIANQVREMAGVDPRSIPVEIAPASQPAVFRGAVANWPLVRAGLQSAEAAVTHIQSFYQNATVGVFLGPPEFKGRFFYNDDLSGFNYQRAMLKLDVVLARILKLQRESAAPAVYVGATTIDTCLPGFRRENDLDLGNIEPLASIWIGNQTRIAAHYDAPDNLACVAVGHRRVTLFPPDQLRNLYVGPLDFTPAGQAISLVDFAKPDMARFPKFAEALASAQVAELGPGDAIFIPSMWWHHIEALDSFNVLINYWWRQSPDYMDSPTGALLLAIMTMRDLPKEQLMAWQTIFRHYVFEADEATAAHIPDKARGVLAPLDEAATRELRAQLLKRLNR